jgi:hypothetical protein
MEKIVRLDNNNKKGFEYSILSILKKSIKKMEY